jgi:prephenate dehydratase
MIIGYLGPEATFTHQAVVAFFPNKNYKQFDSIPRVIDGLVNKEVDFCVVPIENSIEGTVNLTLDYLIHDVDCKIVGELTLAINQHLMINRANINVSLNDFELVCSHPQAIAQSHKFIHNELPSAKVKLMNSTGAAAKYVSENSILLAVAISNELAAEKYELEIIKKNIQSYENNFTRFIVLAPKDSNENYSFSQTSKTKATILIDPPNNQAGLLHQILSAFAWRKLDLSKIESRPAKTGLGKYYFIVDVQIVEENDHVLLEFAKSEIEAMGSTVTVLGIYPYI